MDIVTNAFFTGLFHTTPQAMIQSLLTFAVGLVLAGLAIWLLVLGLRERGPLHPLVAAAFGTLLAVLSIIVFCMVGSWWSVGGFLLLVLIALLGASQGRPRRRRYRH